MWYILTNVWVLFTPNAGQNMLFNVFCAKNGVFKSAPECWLRVLFPVQHPNTGQNQSKMLQNPRISLKFRTLLDFYKNKGNNLVFSVWVHHSNAG